jgi:hypothetical protein
MIKIVVCGGYVAGIFSDQDKLDAYLKQKPDWAGSHFVFGKEQISSYPVYLTEYFYDKEIMDRYMKFNVFADRESAINAFNRDSECHIWYEIPGDWQPENPWHDEMGALEHHHKEEDKIVIATIEI